jgi:hypothetical protein
LSLTKLSLGGNNKIIPAQGESLVSDIPTGDGNDANHFLRCMTKTKIAWLCFFQ